MKLLQLFFIVSVLAGCSILKAKNVGNKTKADVNTISTSPRQVKFIGIAHVAKPELYADIVQQITALKKEGYVLFYEHVDYSLATEEVKRKTRKLVGIVPDKNGYSDRVEEGKVQQNNDDFLGLVNALDFNVDVEAADIINEYEKRYGNLVLDSADIATPIEQKMIPSEPMRQALPVILDYRNEYVVNQIKSSKYDKIVILYGALHEKGMKKLLKNQ